jgi:hypothetical protein
MRSVFNQEEYNPDDTSLQIQQRMADLNQNSTDKSLLRSEEAQRERNRLQVEGVRGLASDVGEGVTQFVDRKLAGEKAQREEARLARQEAREQTRADRESEEFGLRKPELQARANTAQERTDAELKGSQANTRSANVSATNAEKEMAWLEKQASGPKALANESNRDYVTRMKKEGDIASVELAKAQLNSYLSEAPLRVASLKSTIASQGASTKAQQLANTKAMNEADLDNLMAIAKSPTSENAAMLGPHLNNMLQNGKITPMQAGRVVGAMKAGEYQNKVQQSLLPEVRAKFEELETTKKTLRQSADGLIQMAAAVNQNKNGLMSDNDSIANFSNALRAMGRENDAQSIESSIPSSSDVEKGNFTRQQRMTAKLNQIASELRMKNIDPEIKNDPTIQHYLSTLSNIGNGNMGNQPTNLFSAPKQDAGQFNINGQKLNFQGQGQMATPVSPSPSGRPRQSTAVNFGGK